ncbi:MAG: hypothetical protein JWO15_2826 [Sphingomonadales bacterium]|nr:hypothetical protein [Sphingomonadales bacterium]
MRPRFAHYVAIDWSGAVGPRQPGIAVAICGNGTAAPVLVRPGHIWSREDVFDWLTTDMPEDSLVGLDLSAAFAFADRGAYFPGWSESPNDARSFWALVDRISASDPNMGASSFIDHVEISRHFRRHGGRKGDLFEGTAGRLRRTEIAQRAQGLNPYSNFNLVGAAQVGKSSLTGMRLLHRLDGRMALWPFDPLPASGSVVTEIYTSLAAITAGLPKGRTKMRDAAALDAALANIGSEPHAPMTRYTDHATDAILTSAWLRAVADDPDLWSPPDLSAIATTEGWTFGVR